MVRRAVVRPLMIGALVTGLGPLTGAGVGGAAAGGSPAGVCSSAFGEQGPVGASVAGEGPSGDPMPVTIAWNPSDWPAGLRDVITCVSIDGRAVPALARPQGAPPNSGTFNFDLTLPAGAPGSLVCQQSVLIGAGSGGEQRRPTNALCFKLRGSDAPPVDQPAGHAGDDAPATPPDTPPARTHAPAPLPAGTPPARRASGAPPASPGAAPGPASPARTTGPAAPDSPVADPARTTAGPASPARATAGPASPARATAGPAAPGSPVASPAGATGPAAPDSSAADHARSAAGPAWARLFAGPASSASRGGLPVPPVPGHRPGLGADASDGLPVPAALGRGPGRGADASGLRTPAHLVPGTWGSPWGRGAMGTISRPSHGYRTTADAATTARTRTGEMARSTGPSLAGTGMNGDAPIAASATPGATGAADAEAPRAALARTGVADRIPLAAGGSLLALGGAAIVLAEPRRRARPARAR